MEKSPFFLINKLFVCIVDKQVLYDINLNISKGTIHAIMGPNGSGKSTFAHVLMGHPSYTVASGTVLFNEVDLLSLSVHERAKQGLFLAFQHPCEISGVSVASFLKEAYVAIKGKSISVIDFQVLLLERCAKLEIDASFIFRGFNEGFSGGEKKRLEILQLLLLQPKIAILDEIDSGLDIDSLKIVAHGIALARDENPEMSIIVITHYQRILNYVIPDYVHVLCDGRMVISGDASIAHQLEAKGYDGFKTITT